VGFHTSISVGRLSRRAAAAAVLVAAACTPVALADSGNHSGDGGHLKLFAVVTNATSIDVDRDGEASVGDQLLLQVADYDKAGGEQIGTGTSVCVSTDPGNYDCQGSDALPGGELREAGRVLASDPTHFHWAVIGGTGKYRGVGGQLDGTFTDANFTQAEITFTLETGGR
jgi:hypothetical protein